MAGRLEMETATHSKKSVEQGSRIVLGLGYAWVVLAGGAFGVLGAQQLQGAEPIRGLATLTVGALVLGAAWLMRHHARAKSEI